ncbi:MAG: alpha/beta fold hydrolase [Mycobacterium sp.]|jgi:polyhydroxyalkanoate synthase|uniref:alpha/beta fold hydrolase n=1 Tax=Mycobacterium sp. TaxID=1785 RepID=UPI003899EA39
MSVVDRVRREVERNALRARNGIRLTAGVRPPDVGLTAKDIVWRKGRTDLWRYRSEQIRVSPPLLIVYSLFNRSYILDLQPGNSFVEHLLNAGFDVYLLDFGIADERDAGNTLDDYADEYLPAAVDRVCQVSHEERVNMLGYCFGGVLSVLYAAHDPDAPLRSLTVLTTPADFQRLGQLGDLLGGGLDIATLLDADGNVPADIILQGFRTLRSTGEITQYVDLWERLWSDEYVAAYQAMTGWATEQIPLPGGVVRQIVDMVRENPLMTERLVVGGDRFCCRTSRCRFCMCWPAAITSSPRRRRHR